MGFAYKANTSDFRNTKVIDVFNELKSFGLEVDIYDPLVNIQEVKEKYSIEISSNLEIESYQVLVKLVNHLAFEHILSDKVINVVSGYLEFTPAIINLNQNKFDVFE